MFAKRHFLLILVSGLWLNGAAPAVNPTETEAEYRHMLDDCRASACAALPALLNTFGGFYFAERRYVEAEPLLKEAVSLNKGQELAFTLSNLAAVYRILGRIEEAAPMFDRALQLLEELSPNGPELPRVLTGAAMVALDPRAEIRDAVLGEARCRRALELLDKGSAAAATAHNTLAAILETLGRFAEAERELRATLAARERLFGADDPQVAETLDKLGLACRQQGRLGEAETLYRRALAMLRARPAEAELATVLNNLGNTLAAAGHVREAERDLREAITIWEKVLGPDSLNVAAALSNLSALERTRHRYAEAERLLNRAMAIDRGLLPPGHARIGLDLNNEGTLLAARKRYAEAEGVLRQALEILKKGLPDGHPEIGRVLVNLGEVLRLERKRDEAVDRYKEGLEILTRAWGADDARLLGWLGTYARMLRDREEFAEAARTDMQAMRIRVRAALR